MARFANNVCTHIVNFDLCVGCGVCAGLCPVQNLRMIDSFQRGYVPEDDGHCLAQCCICLAACPFADCEEDEDTLSRCVFGETHEIRHTPETGYFMNTYAGHVSDTAHRWCGASGGIATWFLGRLLRSELVDHVICVAPHDDPDVLFSFQAFSDHQSLLRGAKSAYYPVEMSQAIRCILETPGRYAVIGLPCFIKSLRLAMKGNSKLRERIVLCAGLVCSHLVGKGMAEYLVRRIGMDPQKVNRISFREKARGRPSDNFCFRAVDMNGQDKYLDFMGAYSAGWAKGLFSLNACNFCDDIFAELADITFMDAWLPEYIKDDAGNSLVITRSPLADRVLNWGIQTKELSMGPIPVRQVIASQRNVIHNKRIKLSERLWLADRARSPRPRKRVAAHKPALFARWVHAIKEESRRQSFMALDHQRGSGVLGLDIFRAEMKSVTARWERVRWAVIVKRFADRIKKALIK